MDLTAESYLKGIREVFIEARRLARRLGFRPTKRLIVDLEGIAIDEALKKAVDRELSGLEKKYGIELYEPEVWFGRTPTGKALACQDDRGQIADFPADKALVSRLICLFALAELFHGSIDEIVPVWLDSLERQLGRLRGHVKAASQKPGTRRSSMQGRAAFDVGDCKRAA